MAYASAYDKCQEWDTSREQDVDMVVAANAYIKEDFDVNIHNCYQLGYDSLTGAGFGATEIDPHRGYTPIQAFKANERLGSATSIPITIPE